MNALIVVARRPAPGHAKTRLSPPFSPAQAAQLYEGFLLDSLDLMRQVPQARRIIAYLPEGEETYFKTLAPDFDLLPQRGADLGERLDNALADCLANGYTKAVIMDSDSPSLPVLCLTQAFVLLDSADAVLGPCDDGGYYLIGLKRPAPRLLRDVPMSRPTVARDTLALARQMGLSMALLPGWYDVDTAAELQRLTEEMPALPEDRARHARRALADFGFSPAGLGTG